MEILHKKAFWHKHESWIGFCLLHRESSRRVHRYLFNNGHGTTFKIYLPASQKAVAEEKEVPTEFLKLKTRRRMLGDKRLISNVPVQILDEKEHGSAEE